MADPLSITSLILNIGSIIPCLITYARGVRDAGSDIRRLTEELFALKGILEHLNAQFEAPPSSLKPSTQVASDSLTTIIQNANESLQLLLSDIKEPANKSMRVKQKLGWPFTQEQLNTHLNRIERVKSCMILFITNQNNALQRDLHGEITSLRKCLEEDLKVRNDEKNIQHEELLRWLAPVSPRAIHLQASQARASHTGKWFVDNVFKEWLRNDDTPQAISVLLGKSGIGKTTLFAHIVDVLISVSSDDSSNGHPWIFAYFYCTFDEAASQDPVNILGSLLAQVSESIPSALDSIWPLYKATTSAHRRPIDIGALEDAIVQHTYGGKRVILLIDAINECVNQEIIIRSLLKISNSVPSLRVLVTATADLIPRQHANIFHMSSSTVKDDIDAYIRFRLQQDRTFRNLSTSLQDQIWETLLQGADGSFRWVHLSLETLGSLRTAKQIREALNTLPGTLRELYTQILERIPHSDWELSRNALFWLSFSKRSLTLSELNEAVLLEETCTELDDEQRLVTPQILLEICQGLINKDEFGRVKLSHASIKDFLTSDWIRSSTVQYFSLNPVTADETIMRLCLTYLSLDNFRPGYVSSMELIVAREEKYPFLEYAAHFWAIHGESCSFNAGDRNHQLVHNLLHSKYLPRRGNFGVWIQTLIPEASTLSIETTHPLYYAASFGLVSVVKTILPHVPIAEVDARGGRNGSTPLFAACWRGNYETAELLLQAGANPYIVDPSSSLTIFSLPKSAELSRIVASLPKGLENVAMNYDTRAEANILHAENSAPSTAHFSESAVWDTDIGGGQGIYGDIHSLPEDSGPARDFLIAVPASIDPTLEGFEKQIRQSYPQMDSYLIRRLASYQVRRHSNLLHFQRDHSSAVMAHSCPSNDYCSSLRDVSSSHQHPNAPAGSSQKMDASQNSEDISVTAGTDNTPLAEFPPGVPLPPVSLFPSKFECPICFQVKNFQKQNSWMRHVFDDLAPYTCTFPDCSQQKLFKRKADWVRHETERHRRLEWWACSFPDCNHECYRKDSFVQHLVREHKMPEPRRRAVDSTSSSASHLETQREININALWETVEQCHHQVGAGFHESCRFCGKVFDVPKKLAIHVGKHLESLAMPIFSLVQQVGASNGTRPYPSGISGRQNCD